MSKRPAGAQADTPNPLLRGDEGQAGRNMQDSHTGHGEWDQREENTYIVIKIPRWLFYGIIVAVLAVALTVFLVALVTPPTPDVAEWSREVQDRVGKNGVDMFTAYDLNRDGYLSILEFEPFIPHLQVQLESVQLPSVLPKDEFFHYTPGDGEEVISMQAAFQPLQMETMTKEDILDMVFGGSNPLHGLKTWQAPSRPHAIFGVNEFSIFLPQDKENIPLGKPYHIVPKSPSGLLWTSPDLSSSRYYPPAPTSENAVLFRLLGMMHSRPFITMRFQPRGTVACVRAFNAEYLHIIFRMHAEFQLNEPPINPFWFTPAQFLGDLVISTNGSHILYFHMEVPNERRLNVDMEWLTSGASKDEKSMEVDIGYMPQMEWNITSQSYLPLPEGASAEETQPKPAKSPESVEWDSLISREDTLRLIETEFFPFKVVKYHNLTQAYHLSREQNKPIHALFLWGALDDQSC